MTVIILCSCKREEQTVFTDTVYASGNDGYSVSGGGDAADLSETESENGDVQDSVQPDLSGEEAEDPDNMICVFVCGAVNCEGVYELPEDSRIIDAVEAAGGYADDADRVYVNQAEYVYDTQRIEIPTFEEARILRETASDAGEGIAGQGSAQQGSGLININTADRQELMRIPGIGESKAERIIEYRQLHGRFGSTEELMNVSGIGSGMYEKMKDCITVN